MDRDDDRRLTIAREAAHWLAAVRAQRPLVQTITNLVSMDVAANVMLAVGAAPAMVHAPEEAGEFAAKASALVVNTGTLSAAGVAGMEAAATAAHALGVPWALDPVGAGGTRFRDGAVQRLLRHRPSVIRGNASEIIAVARLAGLTDAKAAPRGVESAHDTSAAEALAVRLARHGSCVVAATGAVDIVTDGRAIVRLANGSPLMTRVTALGCGLSGLVGAVLGAGAEPLPAAVSALAVYAIAGDVAAETAQAPGSFRVAFIDALYRLSRDEIEARLRLG